MSGPRVVRLVCPGGFQGEAINATGYLRRECREKRCRAPDGTPPTHVWDLSTGWLVDEPTNQAPETAREDDKP
jgi:hypothetical protein